MSAPQSAGPGAGPETGPSLFDSLRSFWSVLLAILYTRLDLATDEIEEQARLVAKLLLAGVIAVLALAFAFMFANIWIIACYWDTEYRLLTIGLVFGAYLLIGVIAALAARNLVVNRPKIFSQTIAELRRDVEGLTRTIAAKKDES
jgi:uncharacterized membrane protein YqjE